MRPDSHFYRFDIISVTLLFYLLAEFHRQGSQTQAVTIRLGPASNQGEDFSQPKPGYQCLKFIE